MFSRGADVLLAARPSTATATSTSTSTQTAVYNFTVLLERGSWYSLTTLPDGAVAKGEHAHSELPALFPLPHADAFDEAGNYTAGRSPKFFTDWDGSFSLEADPHGGGAAGGGIGGGLVLRQLVPARPLHWHCTDVDPITLVSSGHANYAVGVRARIDSSTTESYSSTHVAVWARVLRPYSGWCPALSGYRLRLTPSGEWFLEAAPPASGKAMAVLAKGVLPSGFDGRAWHELLLTADGSKLTASVDGALLATVQDTSFDSGSAALGSGFHLAAFRAFNLTALRPPAPAAVAATSPTVILAAAAAGAGAPTAASKSANATLTPALAAFCTFTNVGLQTNVSGWFGFAFTPQRAITVTHVARFAARGSSRQHDMRIVDAASGEVVSSTTVDIAPPVRQLDSTGMVWSALSSPAALTIGQQYYVAAQEAAGGDPFYGAAAAQPCAGHILAGGTLPRMNVPTDAIKIDGGVQQLALAAPAEAVAVAVAVAPAPAARGRTADDGGNGSGGGGAWTLLPDWEPRSFGPVSFMFV
jgi:hypothetical protein